MLRKSRLIQKTKSLLAQTRQDVSRMTFGTALYAKSLDRAIPQNFTLCPPDVWLGDPARGAELIAFTFGQRPENLAALVHPDGFDRLDDRFHAFGWLNDLRDEGSANAREAAVHMIDLWLQQNSLWHEKTWAPDLLAERILRWIGAYAFYLPALDPDLNERLALSVARQGRHLKHIAPTLDDPMDGLRVGAGLVGAGIALAHDPSWIESGLSTLEHHATHMILSDGGPHTRRASDLPIVLRLLIDVRGLLNAAALPVPPFLTHAIDRVVPALRFFRLGDHKLTTFHGAGEGSAVLLEDVLRQSGVQATAPASLPLTGFERMKMGRTQLVIDTGEIPTNAPAHLHASLMAFEMSVGEDRLIVSCGQHAHDTRWQDLLSATAAHSTLTIDDLDNAPFLHHAKGHHPPVKVNVARQDTNDAQLVEGRHNGYVTRNGFHHRRRFYLDANGTALRGEDDLGVTIPPVMPARYTVRFHLHPKVSAALVTNGREILLRLPTGEGWRFSHDGEHIALEDSVYLGETGLPQKTRQIVVTGLIRGAKLAIRWALRAEPSVSVA